MLAPVLGMTGSGMTGYLTSRQLGMQPNLPRYVEDIALVAPLICTADDDYQSIAPDLDNPDLNPEPPTYAMSFCPVSGHHNLLCLANEDGAIYVQNTDHVLPKLPLTGRKCHENAIFAFCWAEREANKLVTASGDQSLALWDLETEAGTEPVRRLKGHNRSVKTVEWRPNTDHELASAGRDNTVMIWDLRSSNDTVPENSIRSAHSAQGNVQICGGRKKGPQTSDKGSSCSVTGLCWLDTNTLASVGDSDGKVKLWDMRKHYNLYRGDPLPKLEVSHPGTSSNRGFTTLSTDLTSSYIYVSCMDSNIYQYDIVNTFEKPTAIFSGADIKNFFVKHSLSPCGRYLASGSSDHACYIWHTSSPGSPVAKLGPQEAEVTCVSWNKNPSSFLLAAASDDMRHRLWRDSRSLPEEETVRGRAEILGKVDTKPTFVTPPKRCLTRTPQSGRIRGNLRTPQTKPRHGTPSISAFLNVTPKNSPGNTTLEKKSTANSPQRTPVNEVKRGLKRRTVDFNDENSEPEVKASRYEDNSRRDLSSSISGLLVSSPSSKCTFSPTSYQSPTKRQSSPRKLDSPLKNLPLTPARINVAKSDLFPSHHGSPTANLPNLVLDGRSPRLKPSTSTVNRPAIKTMNWLTEMAKKRQLHKEGEKESSKKKILVKKTVVKKVAKKV